MSDLTKGREFQLWEYHVSHGSLLIRSPAGLQFETSIDIIFVGVEYLAAPHYLREVTVSQATEAEIERIEKILGKKLFPPSTVWALQSSHQRSFVAAAALKIQEHRGSVFDSPFS